MNVLKVNFKDGVYLNGTVKQNIGVAGSVEQALGVSGLTLVNSIEANPVGVTIAMGDRVGVVRFFFVPWQSIASCEVADPRQTLAESRRQASLATDLLGDEDALEKATRPPGKPAKA